MFNLYLIKLILYGKPLQVLNFDFFKRQIVLSVTFLVIELANSRSKVLENIQEIKLQPV